MPRRNDIVRELRREPWIVLVPLLAAQWIALGIFAVVVRHNGWVFYQGGDETAVYTTSWMISQGDIPEARIGYGWSYLLAPVARLAGPNFLNALPAIVLIQTLVLLPLALVAVYAAAARIAGRLIGYLTAALWVFAPYLAIPLFVDRYHGKYIEQFLPQALGLTGLSDFPATVSVLVAAYFFVRALETRAGADAAWTGLAVGFAIAIKPSAALFLPAPVIGLLLARRPRQLALLGAAALPSLLTLAVWKARGLGHIPLITPEPPQAYAAPLRGVVAAGLPTHETIARYLHLDWGHLRQNFAEIREFFWSVRLLQWLAIAGVIAVARRSVATAAFLATWVVAFYVVKGASPLASVESGSYWRLTMPGYPAFLLLAAMVPTLAPEVGQRLVRAVSPRALERRARHALAVTVVVVFAVMPLLLFAVFAPAARGHTVKNFGGGLLLPLNYDIELRVVSRQGKMFLSWRPPDLGPTRAFYTVFRSPVAGTPGALPQPDPSLPRASQGVRCLPPTGGAADCTLEMEVVQTTLATSWTEAPPSGRWTYRVGVASNWLADPAYGDVFVVSTPVNVTVP